MLKTKNVLKVKVPNTFGQGYIYLLTFIIYYVLY